MKALTICQPYAEMIANHEKPIENRTWPTSYRGPLAIHAGKSRAWLPDLPHDQLKATSAPPATREDGWQPIQYLVKKLRDRAIALNSMYATVTASDAVHAMRDAADLLESQAAPPRREDICCCREHHRHRGRCLQCPTHGLPAPPRREER